jgi:hypothetical protein
LKRLVPALLLLLVAALSGCRGDVLPAGTTVGARAETTSGPWTALPAPPLSPRFESLTGWTGREALFIGGHDEPEQCIGFGGCFVGDYVRDGAAYDPATGAWRPIAAAPVGVGDRFAHVMAGDRMVLLRDTGAWLMYDSGSDTWSGLPSPARPVHQPSLAVDGHLLYAVTSNGPPGPVAVLDLDTETWSTLPVSPHEPRLVQRTLLSTPQGLALFGIDRSRQDYRPTPPLTLAEVWDGQRWRRLPAGHVDEAFEGWHWTGTHAVALVSHAVPGVRGDLGVAALDVSTGRWRAPCPEVLGSRADLLGLRGGAGPLVATGGYLYDDSTGAWVLVPRPPYDEAAASSTVFAGGRVLAFGGEVQGSSSLGHDSAGSVSNEAWSFDPALADPAPEVPREPLGGAAWTRLPDPPLQPRTSPVVAHLGDRVVVVGGVRRISCPPRSGCRFPGVYENGAAYDLETRSWRRIAPVPLWLGAGAPVAVDGDRLVALGGGFPGHVFVYDAGLDRWTRMPLPPHPLRGNDVVTAARGRVYVADGDDSRRRPGVQVLDLRTRRWEQLPRSANRPLLGLRRLLMTTRGLMVMGATYDPRRRSHVWAQAEVYEDHGWKRFEAPHLPASGWDWHWTGRRLVAPFLSGPHPRGAAVRVGRGYWRWLPERPAAGSGGWTVDAAGDGNLLVQDGYVYDDRRERFTRVVAPPGVESTTGGAAAWVGHDLVVLDTEGHAWSLDTSPVTGSGPVP